MTRTRKERHERQRDGIGDEGHVAMRSARRLFLVLTVMAAATLIAGGMALAAVIEGGSGDNTLKGTDGADKINGNDGKDTIFGLGGNDEIDGGNHADQLFAHDDLGTAASGDDIVKGRAGNDRIEGGSGADTLNGGQDNDVIIEGPKDDDSADAINGGDGGDRIYAGNGSGTADIINCGAGEDEVKADPVDDVAADCEIRLPNSQDEVAYSSEWPSGEIIPASGGAEPGDEIGGVTVTTTDTNGNVISEHTETQIAGEPDAYTTVDESRQEPEVAPTASYCNRVRAWRTNYGATGYVAWRFYQEKYWCYNGAGGSVYNVKVSAYPEIYTSFAVWRGIVAKHGYFYYGGARHYSYRSGHIVNEIPRVGNVHHYPWVKIWVHASGYWHYDYGGA